MRHRVAVTGAALVLSLLLSSVGEVTVAARVGVSRSTPAVSAGATPALQLLTEPDDGFARIDQFFSSPSRTLDLTMYELGDATIEHELASDASRGVKVRVLLDKTGEESNNQPAFTYLSAHGVSVEWASGFHFTHEKSAVADGSRALVMTLNLTSRYYASTRDFAVFDNQAPDVRAIEATFAADWAKAPVTAPTGADLLWSPGSEAALVSLIGSARHKLLVENEEMADTYIVDALAAAAKRGVTVDVVMTKDSEWDGAFSKLRAAGAVVFADPDSEARLYIHAKVIVVDPGTSVARAFVGSENFSETSLLDNRELGLVTSSTPIVRGLADVLGIDIAAGPTGGVRVET